MKESAIEWTNDTWNPWHGCKKVSEGCKNCYMYRDKKRWGQDGSVVKRASAGTFSAPLRLKGPLVFTCSWSDFFIEEADAWRAEAWDIIRKTPHLTYQILTKRPELIWDRLPDDWEGGYPNVWLGTSVENQEAANKRLLPLLNVPAKLHFISAEPLLGPVNLTAVEFGRKYENGKYVPTYFDATKSHLHFTDDGDIDQAAIGWVISGGESGPGFRPADPRWFYFLRDQCHDADIPFFHKQNGGNQKEDGAWGGFYLGDVRYREMPQGVR